MMFLECSPPKYDPFHVPAENWVALESWAVKETFAFLMLGDGFVRGHTD